MSKSKNSRPPINPPTSNELNHKMSQSSKRTLLIGLAISLPLVLISAIFVVQHVTRLREQHKKIAAATAECGHAPTIIVGETRRGDAFDPGQDDILTPVNPDYSRAKDATGVPFGQYVKAAYCSLSDAVNNHGDQLDNNEANYTAARQRAIVTESVSAMQSRGTSFYAAPQPPAGFKTIASQFNYDHGAQYSVQFRKTSGPPEDQANDPDFLRLICTEITPSGDTNSEELRQADANSEGGPIYVSNEDDTSHVYTDFNTTGCVLERFKEYMDEKQAVAYMKTVASVDPATIFNYSLDVYLKYPEE
ncbi:MAG TPA: hypothetical protein VF572_06315 [Candidatus Saccharimonadales bacterium]